MFDISSITTPISTFASAKNSYDSDMRRYKELHVILRQDGEEREKAYAEKDYKKADAIQKRINMAYKEFVTLGEKIDDYQDGTIPGFK